MRNKTLLILLGSLISACGSAEDIKYEQYLVNGEQHYLKHCSNCHQADGSGLKDLYPPIAGSDFLKDRDKVICLIRYGISGEILVNGKKFNQAMPANKQLYDLDIAELTTYMYSKWGGGERVIPVDTVKKVMEQCQVKE